MKKLTSVIVLIVLMSATVFAAGAAERAKPRIGIISAMSSELSLLVDTLDKGYIEETIGKETFYIGTLNGKDVVLVKAGVGKALAASYATVLLTKNNY
jgi:nucleoside phosphorylase